MNKSDEALLRDVAGGDVSSLRTLYERHKARVMSYSYYMLRDRAKAEDVLQEAFLRVFRHAGRFAPGSSFPAWLHSIAANLCRDEFRRMKRRRAVHAAIPLDWVLRRAAARTPSPRRSAAGKEFAGRLREELAMLPPEQREVVTLHYLSGMKYREIADTLGCPLGTVQSRLHSGVKKLRERLTSFVDEIR